MSKYDYIYLFSNLFSLISLNGPSGRKKAQEGENSQGEFGGIHGADPGGPKGAHHGPAHHVWPHQAMGDSPTLPGWQGWPPWEPIQEGAPLAF